jgi:hypothetical protein
MRKRYLFAGVLFFAAAALISGDSSRGDSSMRRFGIFIGSNNGGGDRTKLQYAVSDARSVSKVFFEMGGISSEDMVLLVEPGIREINSRIDAMQEQVLRSKTSNKRTEIVFYYSGHSDEEGLLLNREKYSFRELRNRINSIPSDMRIVILDSCASGAFTRIKGGNKTQPFLVDSSVSAEGYAFLTSSSADEVSQESDRIAASYFTHSLVAGLRGAADSVGDGRVTLNELYRFTYSETLARTETSAFGAQHPSYDIQVNGTGDLVLTDVKETSAGMVFDEKLTGRLSIRDKSDHLVAEITKTTFRPLELGLEPGIYRVTLQQGNDLLRAEFTLSDGQRTFITLKNFTLINASPARSRGGEDDEGSSKSNLYTFFVNNVYENFHFPLIGFVNTAIGNHNLPQIGYVNSNTGNFNSLQISFINTVGGNLNGIQTGFINTIGGNLNGIQAGFINTVEKTDGIQFGFINTSTKGLRGVQIGFINYADSVEEGVPIGFLSIVKKGGYCAIEYSFSEFFPVTLGLKIGLEKFYTTIYLAQKPADYDIDRLGEYFAMGIGLGSIIPITNSFFFNPEIIELSSLFYNNEWGDEDEYSSTNFYSLIPFFGFKIGKHFSITAGPSATWIHRRDKSFPEPLFKMAAYDIIDDNHRIIIGARAALRWRF